MSFGDKLEILSQLILTKCVSLVASSYIIHSSSKYLSGHLFSMLSLMEVSLLSFVVIVINIGYNNIVFFIIIFKVCADFYQQGKS